MNKNYFYSNTYTQNFFTGGNSLIHLEGAVRVFFSDETFTSNGDNTNEAISVYGSGILSPATSEITIASALSNQGAYSSTTLGQSLITIKRAI